MYNPDILGNDSPEIAVSPDRKEKLDKLVEDIHKAGYGVTRVGDRVTIRNQTVRGSYYEVQFVVLEVKLQRDFDKEREGTTD